MRILAVLLLVLNAGYFAWQQGWLFEREIRSPGIVSEPFEQAPQALVLLSEIPAAQRQLMDQIADSGQVVAGARRQLENAEDQAAEVRAELADAGSRSPSAEPQAGIEPELARESEVPPPPLEEPALPWCGIAGVFADEAAATAYISRIRNLGAGGTIESRRERVASVWWVHFPAFATEAAARRVLAELKTRNIDSFYMADGELAGGISLGVYSSEDRAKTAQAQLATRGYTASIAEVDRLGTRFYVEVELPDSTLLASPEWAALQASQTGLSLTEKLCEVIAP